MVANPAPVDGFVQRAVFACFLTHRQVRTNREVQQIEKCNFALLHPAGFLTLKTSMFIQWQKTAYLPILLACIAVYPRTVVLFWGSHLFWESFVGSGAPST